GYIPQAMTHGTMECTNLEASVKFYKEGLGLDVITHVPTVKPHDIKHLSTPWYIASLEIPEKNRKYLTPLQRYTVAVDSSSALTSAHAELQNRRDEFAIRAIDEIEDIVDGKAFLLSGLNLDWGDIAFV